MSDIKVYCVVRTQRGYNYDNFDEMDKVFDTFNTDRAFMRSFTQFWKSVFKYPYANVRRELRELCFESIRKANFDKVYWCLEDFVDELSNINEDILVYFTDDDDWIRSDAPRIIKENYISGYDALVWTHVRVLPFNNQIVTPNVNEATHIDGTKFSLNFTPYPYIQSNHCVVKYPSDPTTNHGIYIPEFDRKIPVNHYCVNYYLHEPGRKYLYINEVLSIYNSTPASIAYYENDFIKGNNPVYINKFDEKTKSYYIDTKKFVEEPTYGVMELFPSEFEPYLNKTKTIFKKCL